MVNNNAKKPQDRGIIFFYLLLLFTHTYIYKADRGRKRACKGRKGMPY